MKSHEVDVTIEMIEVLYILWNKDYINQQEIVDKTNRNKASITSLIDNMTARGLVKRNADPTDRRNNLIALTKEGKMYQLKLVPLLEEMYATFQVGLSNNEIENTTFVLQKILRGMS
ncbi:MAG: MarR family winged helix-turn-helix transcriptional regulator [Weeksellaceae bacterium]|nr:MarR family winged helix-turn-helix transcriptional regulator [Weeksellaceae bacterium]